MHNWRLLLLAFIAVFQPIATFTERRVDGRQRCDYRGTALLRDPGVHFHGTYRFTKPAVEDRRLNQREDVRKIRHNEVREASFRTTLQSRGDADEFENSERIVPSFNRLSRTEYSLTRNAAVLSRETRDERKGEYKRARQTTLDSRLSVSDDERRILSRRSSSGLPMERHQESRRNLQITEAQRARVDSTRNARRIAKERTPRMDVRSETRMQLERSANNEMKRYTGARENRADDSLDHERRSSGSRQSLNIENLRRTRDARDSILRERMLAERLGRDLSARTRDSDHLVENRRDFSYRDARIRSQRNVEARREIRSNERDTRLTRATRMEENRVSRNSERETSIETRRGDVIRNMEKNYRTTQRTAENRRNIRSHDRENQRDMRKTVQELQGMQLDRERITEVRGESRDVNRQSCSLNNERKSERRSSERVDRLLADRHDQIQRSSRISRLQRDAENERATRKIRRESSLGRNIRMDFGNIRKIENERSPGVNRRESQNAESRRVTDEHDNGINTDRRSPSFDRLVHSRRDTREGNRGARVLRDKGSYETRENQQRISRASTRDVSEEKQRTQSVESQARITREERNIVNRRDIRSAEMNLRSTRRESSVESRRDNRNVDMENRRTARNTEKDFRAARGKETRVVRARDSLSMDRSFRATNRLNMLDTTVDNRRSRSMERSRRVSENMDLERRAAGNRFITEMTRKREFFSATGKHDEDEISKTNWQYLFYTLQGLYLCGIMAQLMNGKKTDTKTRALSWWSAPQQLIKVD